MENPPAPGSEPGVPAAHPLPEGKVPPPQEEAPAAEPAVQAGAAPLVEKPGGPFWAYDPSATLGHRRGRGPVIVAAVVVLALVAAGAAWFLSRSTATALALDLEPGKAFRYHLQMSMKGTTEAAGSDVPMNMGMDQTFTFRVVSVDKDGIAEVEMKIESASIAVNGRATPVPGFTVDLRVAPDGRILTGGQLSLAPGASSGAAFPGLDQFFPLLPDGPVKPGDTWTKSFDQQFPFGEGRLRYQTSNELLRYEDTKGVRAAVITSSLDLPLDIAMDLKKMLEVSGQAALLGQLPPEANPRFTIVGEVRGEQTNWFDPEAGEVLRTSGTGSVVMTMKAEGFPPDTFPPDGVKTDVDFALTMERLG